MLRNIQVLRAVAALLVVIVHLEVLGAPLGLAEGVFGLFAVGVDLFFVISGFIMVHTTAGRAIAPGAFVANRLARIAPLYWLLTLLVFALALVLPGLLRTTGADWPALLRSLAFIPYERVDGTYRPLLFVGWSLNLEMAFYLLFAMVLPIAGVGRRVTVGIALLCAAVALGISAAEELPGPVRYLTQPILMEFAAGMAIGWLYPHLPHSPQAGRIALFTGGLGLIALVLIAQWPLPGGWPVSLPPAGVVVMAALVAEKSGFVLDWQPLQRIGDASYALYLSHPFVTQAWAVAALKAGVLSPRTAPFLMAGAVASAVLAGLAVHRHVERPLGRWAQRGMAAVGRWRSTPADPAGVEAGR